MGFYPASVTYEKALSKNAHHKITYDTPETLRCRYEETVQIVKDQDGKDAQSSAWVQFPKNTDIGYDDRITLPSGNTAKIVLINPIRDHMDRPVNVDVYLGKTSKR